MKRSSLVVLVSLSIFVLSGGAIQAGETLTVEQIIKNLQNKAPSKDLSIEDIEQKQQNRVFVESSTSGGRVVTLKERRDMADTIRHRELPTIDLEIYFDFDSALVTRAAIADLRKLGQALSDGRLAGGAFIISGHTDAKGDADYNQRLSQLRAQAVRDFLIANFQIAPDNLMAVGYGEEELKLPRNPLAAANRRVQIINWTDVAAR